MRPGRLSFALVAALTLLGVLAQPVAPIAAAPSDPAADGPPIADAPPSVRLEVRGGWDGSGRVGGWIPLDVELTNEGPELRAEVQVRVDQGQGRGTTFTVPTTFALPVVLPRLSHKRFTMEANLPSVSSKAVARLVDPASGTVLVEQEVALSRVPLGDYFCGVLARDPSAYDFLAALELPPPIRRVRTAPLEPATVPERAQLLGSFDCLILDNAQTAQLRQEQLDALQVWVGAGGLLIEVGGPTWQATLSPLPAALLPAEPTGLTQLASLAALGSLVNAPMDVPGPWLVTQSRPRTDSGARVIAAQDGVPLAVAAKRGEGTVIFLAFEPTGRALRGWAGAEPFWRYVIAHSAVDNGVGSALVRPYLRWGRTPRVGLADFTAHPKASLDWLWKLVAVYGVAVVGGVMLLGRRGLTGGIVLGVAGLAVATTALAVGLARQNAEPDAAVTRLSVVRPVEVGDGAAAYTHEYVALLAKHDGEFSLGLPPDALARAMYPPVPRPPGEDANLPASFRVTEGVNPVVDRLSLKQGQLATAMLDGQLRQAPGVQADLRLDGGTLSGSITNRTGGRLTDAYLAVDNQFTPLGTLERDQVRPIDSGLPRQASAGNVAATAMATALLPSDAASRPGGAARRDLLESLFFDRFLFRRMELRGPTLLGWLEQPASLIQAPGLKTSQAAFTLLVQPLQPVLPLGFEGDVPAAAMNRRDLGSGSGTAADQPYYTVAAGDAVTLQFTLPPAEGRYDLEQLRVNVEGQFAGRGPRAGQAPFTVSLYNWPAAEWQAWDVAPGSSIVPDGAKYLSAVGEIRLRYMLDAGPNAPAREVRLTRLDVTPVGTVR